MMINRTAWYQNMAASDISELLDAEQIRDYFEARHPIGRKAHKQHPAEKENCEQL